MEAQPSLGACLQHGSALIVSVDKIRIGFPEKSFFGRQAADQSARDAIATAAESVFGKRPAIEIVLADDAAKQAPTVAQQEASAKNERQNERKQQAMSHPAVIAALKVFPEGSDAISVQIDD